MSQFDEDQRIVIRTLAAEEAARVLKENGVVSAQIGQAFKDKLPRLMSLERVLGNWWGIVGIIIAVPLASAGAASLVQKFLDKGFETHLTTELAKEDGPVKSAVKRFNVFSGKLSEQFAQNVDSASSKLLRFGCNPSGAGAPVHGFPDLPAAQGRGQRFRSGARRARGTRSDPHLQRQQTNPAGAVALAA